MYNSYLNDIHLTNVKKINSIDLSQNFPAQFNLLYYAFKRIEQIQRTLDINGWKKYFDDFKNKLLELRKHFFQKFSLYVNLLTQAWNNFTLKDQD